MASLWITCGETTSDPYHFAARSLSRRALTSIFNRRRSTQDSLRFPFTALLKPLQHVGNLHADRMQPDDPKSVIERVKAIAE
jgi:hypothetical protein